MGTLDERTAAGEGQPSVGGRRVRYREFEVAIGCREGDSAAYPVTVTTSPQGGTPRGSLQLPADTITFQRYLGRLGQSLPRDLGAVAAASAPTTTAVAAARAFGEALFRALFAGQIGESLAVARDRTGRESDGLRLKLRIEAPELAVLPWEYLYDPEQAAFMGLSQRTPLVRSLALARSLPPLTVSPPLRILAMVAMPGDQNPLDVAEEQRRIETALASGRAAGRVELAWVGGPTWRDLQRDMRSGRWHVFHFIGHGELDAERGEGRLALADEQGRTERVGAGALGDLLAGNDLRLVVLNTCLGAQPASDDLFSSTAATLLRRGLAAVVAMQHRVGDRTAIEFARTFYEAVADGSPVDAAVTDARQAINNAAGGDTVEWGTPVLYLNVIDADVVAPREMPPTSHPLPLTPLGASNRSQPTDGARRLVEVDWEWVIATLGRQAARAPGLTPQRYLSDLLDRARWPARWRDQLSGTWTGNAPVDARQLVEWADAKGQNPDDPCLTTLGSLLAALLDDVGLDDSRRLAELLVEHCLCHDQPEEVIARRVRHWAELCACDVAQLLERAVDPARVDQAARAYCQELVAELSRLISRPIDRAGIMAPMETGPERTATNGFGFAAIIDRLLSDLIRWQGDQGPPDLAGDYAGPDPGSPTRVLAPHVCDRLSQVRRGVLLGGPGSGKSWTLLRLTAEYAHQWIAPRPGQATIDRLIPVFVPLYAFAGEQIEPDGTRQPQTVDAYVRASARSLGQYLPYLRRTGRLVLLCDALNAMPRYPPSQPGRNLVAELWDYLKDQPAFIVSCRERDFRPDLDGLPSLEVMRLLDLELDQIREIAQRRLGIEGGERLWRAIGGSDTLMAFYRAATEAGIQSAFWNPEAGDHIWQQFRDLQTTPQQGVPPAAYHAWETMHQGARLIHLCRNPYLLRVICDLYAMRGKLADNRAELFDTFVTTLIEREAKTAVDTSRLWPTTARLLAGLEHLAAIMQAQQVTTIDERLARSTIGDEGGADLVDAAVAASLLAIDGQRVRFTHHRAQEYFAARSLLPALEENRPPAQLLPGDWWEGQDWHETAVILGELLSVGGEGTNGPNRVARWLAVHSPELALEVVLRRGGRQSLASVTPETRAAVVAGARGRAVEPVARGRAAAYRVLGRLDADERPGVGLRHSLPDLYWCAVEGGRCRIGSPDDVWQPLQPREVDIAPFWITRYPITTAQFAAFVEAPDGYSRRDWWTGLQRRAAPREPAFPDANHPREHIDWYEAVAFGRWLTARRAELELPAEMPPSYVLRLPTEIEWEVAAAWEAKRRMARRYPYGHRFEAERGNTDPTGIGRTSAVGLFPAGAAPCGAEEMSGNVWEWTLSPWNDDRMDDMEAPRVLRGGSWRANQNGARTTSRLWDAPTFVTNDLGFRVVAARPLPD